MKNYNGFDYYEQNNSGFDMQDNGGTSSEPYAVQAAPKKSSGIGRKIVVTALCCGILGGAAGAGGTLLGMRAFGNTQPAAQSAQADTTTNSSTGSAAAGSKSEGGSTTIVNGSHSSDSSSNTVNQTKANTDALMTASEVYNANVNSTVGITTSITTNYWGYQTQAAASGSGFIISSDGYILTNHHVIEDADSITVTAFDGTTYQAELIGSDESNDIAVLKIDADGLTPVVLGSSDSLSVGEDVMAIGNPLGELTFSLTKGVVSALDREVTTENTTMNLIQTDCAINSGNSGGALFNMYGEVVGITNAKYSSSGSGEASIDNIGFAIPIDSVRGIVNSLIENGYVMKPYIGVSLYNVSSDAVELGLPKGAAIKAVTDGAPADEAGIQEGDIITEANGEAIESANDLITAVRKCAAGDKLNVKVYRKGETLDLTITVSEKKQETEQTTANDEQQYSESYGGRQQQGQGGYEQFGGFGFPDFGSIFGY